MRIYAADEFYDYWELGPDFEYDIYNIYLEIMIFTSESIYIINHDTGKRKQVRNVQSPF